MPHDGGVECRVRETRDICEDLGSMESSEIDKVDTDSKVVENEHLVGENKTEKEKSALDLGSMESSEIDKVDTDSKVVENEHLAGENKTEKEKSASNGSAPDNEDNQHKEKEEKGASESQYIEGNKEQRKDKDTDVNQPTKRPTLSSLMSTEENTRKMEEEYKSLGVQRCTVCNFTTDDENLYKAHITTCTKKQVPVPRDGQILLHFLDGKYTCKTCVLTWENKGEFDEHVVCHISEDPYVCLSCRKNFRSRQLIEQHARQDHPSGGFKCGLRGIKRGRQFVAELEKNGGLTLFGRVQIPKTPRTISKSTPKAISTEKTYACNEDGKILATSTSIPAEPAENTAHHDELSNANETTNNSSNVSNNLDNPIQPAVAKQALPMISQSEENTPSGSEMMSLPTISDGNPGLLKQPDANVPIQKPKEAGSNFASKQSTVINTQKQVPDVRGLVTKVRPILKKLQAKLSPTTSSSHLTGQSTNTALPINSFHTLPVTSNQSGSNESLTSMFGVVNKETGVLQPALISSKIQKIVPTQTNQKQQEDATNKSPQYHVKHITEYTNVNSTTTTSTSTSVGSHPFYLIPVGPVLHQIPQGTNLIINPLASDVPASSNQIPVVQNVTTHPTDGSLSTNNTQSQTFSIKRGTPVVNKQSISQVPTQLPVLIHSPQKQVLLVNSPLPITNQVVNSPLPITNQAVNSPLPITNQVTVTSQSNVSIHGRDSNLNQASSDLSSGGVTSSTSATNSPLLANTLISTSLQLTPSSTQPLTIDNSKKVIPILPKGDPPGYKETIETLRKEKDKVDFPETSVSVPNSLGTRYLFRIKPGHGFVCEACRKFTKDEFMFRTHIWNHFHVDQKACQSCTLENVSRFQIGRCVLVNNIVCNLIKRSHIEYRKMKASLMNQNEVISISDDEDDKKGTEKPAAGSETEVIVLDEEDRNNSLGLQIHISSPTTISEEVYNTSMNDIKATSLDEIEKEQCNVTNTKPKESALEIEKKNETISINKDPTTDAVIKEMVINDKERNALNDFVNEKRSSEEQSKMPGKGAVAASDDMDVPDESNSSANELSKSVGNNDVVNEKAKEGNANVIENEDLEDTYLTLKEDISAFYSCGYEHCSFMALAPQKYKIHLRSNHGTEYNFVCYHCGQKDFTEESHLRHLNTHASAKSFALYSCPVRFCAYKSNLLPFYICHLNAHIPEDVNLKCVYCHKTFRTTEKLKNHLKENLLKFVNCSYCAFKCGNRAIVMHHIKKFHPEKLRVVTVTSQVVCLEREINFYNPPVAIAQLNEAVLEGNDTALIDIPAILEQIQNESDITEKGNGENVTDIDGVKNIKDGVGLSTDGKKTDVKKPESRSKEPKKGKGGGKTKDSGPKSLLCPHCNYLSYNIALYNRHLSLHEQEPDRKRRFVCNYCPAAVDYYGAFKKHLVNHLGRHEIKLYYCTVCAFNTNLKSHIMDHCHESHDGTGLYTFTTEVVLSSETSCKYCDFKSRQAEHVILHEKMVHQVQPSVSLGKKIDQTGASQERNEHSTGMVNVEMLSDHETPKKHKYHCDYCNRSFKHKAQLVKHLEEEHDDIEDKKYTFYKCKYCPLGSTRKEMIVTHLENEHKGEDIRILRKIEKVSNKPTSNQQDKEEDQKDNASASFDSSEDKSLTEEVTIPDGNVFKSQFKCPKCSFSTLLRLNAIRHLKQHPNLKPVRGKDDKSPKKTARKSTSHQRIVSGGSKQKRHTALIQNTDIKENPFTVVKEAVNKLKEAEKTQDITYNLGEDDLHQKLSACFTPIEKDIKFNCKICRRDITKKFVLHRHILEHLKVIFFKCQYCPEGSVVKTLLFGHIQKCHPSQPLLYYQLCKNEVDDVIDQQIIEQCVDISDTSKATEGKSVADKNSFSDKGQPSKTSRPIVSVGNGGKNGDCETKRYSCTYKDCRYTVHLSHYIQRHLMAHGDKSKNYKCSLCDYRSERINVIKHIHSIHKRFTNAAKTVKIDFEAESIGKKSGVKSLKDCVVERKDNKSSRESSVDSINSTLSAIEGKYVTSNQGKKVKVDSITVSASGVYEIRKFYKCKDCGEKKEGISSLYKHFNTTKCKRPPYRCSMCSFQRYTKIDIVRHSKIRHPGRKLEILTLPLSCKISKLKIPVRHDFSREMLQENNNKQCEETRKSEMIPKKSASDEDSEIECGLCFNYKSESIIKLQHHINTMHDGSQLHCKECMYKTPLIKHMINHCKNVHVQKIPRYTDNKKTANPCPSIKKSPEKVSSFNYKCVQCSQGYSDSGKLRRHLYSSHFKYKPYVCKDCGASLQSLFNMKRHVKTVHSDKTVTYKYLKNAPLEARVEKLINDSKKMRVITTTPSKKRHLESDSDTESPKRKETKLSESREAEYDRTVLDEREIKMEKGSPTKFQVCLDDKGRRIFKCSLCEYTSQEKKNLKQHLTSHSTGARFFRCYYCKFSSKMKSNAYRHCETMHYDKKVRIIDKHNLVLTASGSLGSTSNPMKKRVLKYNCCVCNKRIEGLINFQNHLASHPKFQDGVDFDASVDVENAAVYEKENGRVVEESRNPKITSDNSDSRTNDNSVASDDKMGVGMELGGFPFSLSTSSREELPDTVLESKNPPKLLHFLESDVMETENELYVQKDMVPLVDTDGKVSGPPEADSHEIKVDNSEISGEVSDSIKHASETTTSEREASVSLDTGNESTIGGETDTSLTVNNELIETDHALDRIDARLEKNSESSSCTLSLLYIQKDGEKDIENMEQDAVV